jgi:hypothetical protein
VTLITGDVAFFYDRNGLWHNCLPPNLRVVLLNNHGGGIFRLIDGPAGQPELEEYFETASRSAPTGRPKSSGSSTSPAAPAKRCANICPPFSLLMADPNCSKSNRRPHQRRHLPAVQAGEQWPVETRFIASPSIASRPTKTHFVL